MRSIPVGLLTYRAKSNLFQFCCACACLCLHLVWCTVSASPHGMCSLLITSVKENFLQLCRARCSYFFPSFPPQFDILPLRTILHQQGVGRPLSGNCSRGNTSQGHHQRQKEKLMCLHALVSQLNPGADGQHIRAGTSL